MKPRSAALAVLFLFALVVGGLAIQGGSDHPQVLATGVYESAPDKRAAIEATERQAQVAFADGLAEQQRFDQGQLDAVEKARRAEEARQRQAAQQRASRSAQRARLAPAPPSDLGPGVWAALARCESGGNPRAIGGGGRYFGAFQFALGTWHSLGYAGNPIDYPYGTQLEAAQKLQARSGWGQWPYCARKLGLRSTAPTDDVAAPPAILDERPPVVVNNGPSMWEIYAIILIAAWGGVSLARAKDDLTNRFKRSS